MRLPSLHASAAAALILVSLAAGWLLPVGRPAAAPAAAPRSGQGEAPGDPGDQVVDPAPACSTVDPYVAVAILDRPAEEGAREAAPAVVMLRAGDSPGGSPRVLATQAQVGDVYGLAFDHTRDVVYAAAYHRAGGAYGPGGPGQIYRIDLARGAVEPFVRLAAGPDVHAEARAKSDPVVDAAAVGKTGLGDLDIAADGSELYVTNLHDGRITRIGLPGGEVRDSVLHGAARERWAVDARPFGLGVHDGYLYHGVVNSREKDDQFAPFDLQVYRSRPGATTHEHVLGASLEYGRSVAWAKRWASNSDGRREDTPMLADIAFRPDGAPILGLRDRQADMVPECVWSADCAGTAGPSLGDILPARARPTSGWELIRIPPWFRDSDPVNLDLTWGALDVLPGLDITVAPARPPGAPAHSVAGRLEVLWFDNHSGAVLRSAKLHASPAVDPSSPTADPSAAPASSAVGAGDIEALCGPRAPGDQSLGATLTVEAGAIETATAAAAGIARATAVVATRAAHLPTRIARETAVIETATALAPTLEAEAPTQTVAAATAAALAGNVERGLSSAKAVAVATARAMGTVAAAAPSPAPPTATAYARARILISQSCQGGNPYLVTSQMVPMLDGSGQAYSEAWLAGQPAVVSFHDTPGDDRSKQLILAHQPQVGAVFGVAQDLRREQVYVGAYTKRLADYGPLGPGGIYRIDLATGIVRPWASLYAGRDPHNFRSNFDAPAAAAVGMSGLGDLELSAADDTLFAVNLSDRLIYRFSVPDGAVLGAFPHGAVGLPWAADARPFGLAFRDGWLYHGVVDSLATAPRSGPDKLPERPLAAYVYRSRPDGSAMHEVARIDLDYGRQPAWEPWPARPGPDDPGHYPMLVDIEFREDGDLVVGFRDRTADSRVMIAAAGDLVLTMKVGARFIPLTVPEFYQDNILHAESSWGTMASMPWLDQVVSTTIDPVTIHSGGMTWFDNVSGYGVTAETIYAGANMTFGKAAGLGDVEALCAPLTPTPTATHTAPPTPSSTASATPSTTPEPTRTPTITPTPTPSVYRIYLPFAHNRPCVPEEIHTDVVLVLDMSTSMYRETRGGRTKHAAAIEAAQVFVGLMDFDPHAPGGHDRLGVVGFNNLAWTAIGLSDDRPAVEAAIDGLEARIQEGTRLDLALREGQAVLDRGGPRRGRAPVLILLTDGLPNRVPTPVGGGSQEDTVLAAAEAAKQAGTRLFTIGLGEQSDVLDALMKAAASAPEDYAFAPDGEDLGAIYREIAGRLTVCP